MKKNLEILASVFCSVFILASCSPSYKSVKRMQLMEENVSNPTTKEELEEAIKKFEQRSLDLASCDGQIGIWYKILGTRYLDLRIYGKAYECFQKALMYYPDNANLYYYVGVCAGYLANASLDFEANGSSSSSAVKKLNYLRLAETSFKQALSINPKYYRAMYSLGVLYVFQLEEVDKAVPYLEEFLRTQTKDTDAMFVLARAYFASREFEKAVNLYDKIIDIHPNDEKVRDAMNNKKTALDASYNGK